MRKLHEGAREKMNQKVLYLVVGVLVAATAFLGYKYYESQQEPEGLNINIGKDGIKIDKE